MPIKLSDEFLAGAEYVIRQFCKEDAEGGLSVTVCNGDGVDHIFAPDFMAAFYDYRERMIKQAKIDEARKVLEAAGFHVHEVGSIPSLNDAGQFLRAHGYTVIEPPPAPAPARDITSDDLRLTGKLPSDAPTVQRPGSRHALWRD